MKKFIVLLMIIFLTIPLYNIQAENNFKDIKITEAINNIAEIKEKNILYISEPEGNITFEPDLNKDFDFLLKEILTETKYQFVKHNDYFIIGLFSKESAEFANLSKTIVYETKYLTPEILANKLDYPDVKIRPMNNENEILIQGLPEEVKEVKDKIVRLDKKENFPQIQYELTLIDISKESEKRLNLEELSVSDENNKYFEFYRSNNVLEVILDEIINNMRISTSNTFKKSMEITSPTVVTEISTTGSLQLTEELIRFEEDETIEEETTFLTELTPERLSSEGEIKTDIKINSTKGATFNTNLWLEANKTELIGLMKINRNKQKDSFSGNTDVNNKRTYAVYITARPVSSAPAAKLNGLDKIIFSDHKLPLSLNPSYIQLLTDKEFNPELELFIQNNNSADILSFKGRKNFEFIELGYGLHLVDSLTFDIKAIIENSVENRAALGLVDRVKVTDNLNFSGGYYPVVYLLDKGELTKPIGFIEASYLPNPLYFKLRYNYNMGNNPLRFETGFEFNPKLKLIVALIGEKNNMNKVMAGIRYNF